MFKRRSKLLLVVIVFLIICLLLTLNSRQDDGKVEYIKDLIRKSESNCDLDYLFNQMMINSRIIRGNCSYQDLSFLLGMYEISKDFYYIKEALTIVAKDSSKFNTPSGIPAIGKIVNVDIFSKYALEYYYLGDLTRNFSYLDTVDYGLDSINSLLEMNRTVLNVNVLNPFKSKNSKRPTKLYPVLLKLYMSTGVVRFRDMYSKAISLITPTLKNLSKEECYFPQMLTEGALLDKDWDWTFNLHLAYTLLQDYCTPLTSLDLQSEKDKNCNAVDFEMYFYMYRLTKQSSWRELGWEYLLSFGDCLDSRNLRFAYLLFSKDSEFSLEEFVFSNGFPQSKRGFGARKTFLPLRQKNCLDCVDGYGLDSLLHGAFS